MFASILTFLASSRCLLSSRASNVSSVSMIVKIVIWWSIMSFVLLVRVALGLLVLRIFVELFLTLIQPKIWSSDRCTFILAYWAYFLRVLVVRSRYLRESAEGRLLIISLLILPVDFVFSRFSFLCCRLYWPRQHTSFIRHSLHLVTASHVPRCSFHRLLDVIISPLPVPRIPAGAHTFYEYSGLSPIRPEDSLTPAP